jgi:glycogen phosphorylase
MTIDTALMVAEFGHSDSMPMYAGGLGVLSGDQARSAADLGMKMGVVTIAYSEGYSTQDGSPQNWTPEDAGLQRLGKTVKVPFEGHEINVGAYKFDVAGSKGTVPVLMLTTDVDSNSGADRRITDRLYDADPLTRLAQYVVLGIGGIRMLQALGHSPKTVHMNEGHSSLLTSELFRQLMSIDRVVESCIFTNHSVMETAMPKVSLNTLDTALGNFVPDEIAKIAGNPHSTNHVASHLSRFRNGVALQHSHVLNEMFPETPFDYITNAVHPHWVTPNVAAVLDRHASGWYENPDALVKASAIPPSELWNAHSENKYEAVQQLEALTGQRLDPDIFTFVWARRATGYKRIDLLLSQADVLAEKLPDGFQYIIAGKPHPSDSSSRQQLDNVINAGRSLNSHGRVVFVPDYSISVAKILLKLADAWTGFPQHRMEASGTSGMKAALNGIPSVSNLEGWVYEAGIVNGKTGWTFSSNGRDAVETMLNLRKAQVAYYNGDLATMMPGILSGLGQRFHSTRMMQGYDAAYTGAVRSPAAKST